VLLTPIGFPANPNAVVTITRYRTTALDPVFADTALMVASHELADRDRVAISETPPGDTGLPGRETIWALHRNGDGLRPVVETRRLWLPVDGVPATVTVTRHRDDPTGEAATVTVGVAAALVADHRYVALDVAELVDGDHLTLTTRTAATATRDPQHRRVRWEVSITPGPTGRTLRARQLTPLLR
jgi:hypothetical protein